MDERKLSGTELTYIKRENSKMWFPLFSKRFFIFSPPACHLHSPPSADQYKRTVCRVGNWYQAGLNDTYNPRKSSVAPFLFDVSLYVTKPDFLCKTRILYIIYLLRIVRSTQN